jgi:hypothetical protein
VIPRAYICAITDARFTVSDAIGIGAGCRNSEEFGFGEIKRILIASGQNSLAP